MIPAFSWIPASFLDDAAMEILACSDHKTYRKRLTQLSQHADLTSALNLIHEETLYGDLWFGITDLNPNARTQTEVCVALVITALSQRVVVTERFLDYLRMLSLIPLYPGFYAHVVHMLGELNPKVKDSV